MAREEGNFDVWLSAELRRELSPHSLRPAPAPRFLFQRRRRRRRLPLLAGPPAALGVKAATGLCVTAFAVVATGAAVTGSPNPAVWGAHVRTAVADCKSALDRGQRGWGDCVSTVAGQVQPDAPAPVIEAPAGTNAQAPAVQATADLKKSAPNGKTRPVRSVPTPDSENQREPGRDGGG